MTLAVHIFDFDRTETYNKKKDVKASQRKHPITLRYSYCTTSVNENQICKNLERGTI